MGDCLITDGINLFIYEMSDALIRLGHEVHLIPDLSEYIVTKGKRSLFEQAVKNLFSVERVPEPHILSYHIHTGKSPFSSLLEENLLFAFKGSSIISQISPDMVIFNGATTMFCPFFKVAVSHDLQFRVKISKHFDRIIYRSFDRVAAASTEIKCGLAEQLQMPIQKISVIPTCIDTSRFSPSRSSKRRHAILHVGTRQEKRPDVTIDAFQTIAEHDHEVELLITGNMNAIGASKRAQALLSQLEKKNKDIRERISILGTVSKEKLVELYANVKATSIPSDYVVPLCSPTAIESLASGTPVVGSVSDISKDILIDGYDGFRVQTGNTAMFALRLSSLISSDSAWSEMSKNAAKIAQRCDKMNVAKKYISLYESYANSARHN